MEQKTTKYRFDQEQPYRLVAVTDHQGSDKAQGFYAERLNCIANRLWYDDYPSHGDDLFRMNMRFVENEQGQPICRHLHTSTVRKVEDTDNGGLKIYTTYSIYVLEKAVLKELTYQDAADLVELYLSLEEDYHFARGFYYDKDKKPHDLEADMHLGMFTDSVLIGTHEGSLFGKYLCRYYYNCSNVEFYSASLPMLIHNVGSAPLEIKFECRAQRWTIQPGERKLIASSRKGGEAPDTEE